MTRPHRTLDPLLVVVVPFENRAGSDTLSQLGVMVADYLTEGLMRTGIKVVNSIDAGVADQIAARSRFLFPRGGKLAAIADETGAGLVVTGSYYREGNRLTALAKIHNAATNTLVRQVEPITGTTDAPTALVEAVRHATMGALATLLDTGNVWIAGMREPPSYASYAELRDGIEAFVEGDTASAMRHYARALEINPTYVLPLLIGAYNWVDLGVFGRRADAFDSASVRLTRVEQHPNSVLPSERAAAAFLRAQIAGATGRILPLAEDAFRYQRGSDIAVVAAMSAVWANRPDAALRLLGQSDPDRGINLLAPGYWRWKIAALHLAARHQEELAATDLALRRFPNDRQLHAMRAGALAALGRRADAVEEAERMLAQATDEVTRLDAEAIATVADELRMHGDPASARTLRARGVTTLRPLASRADPGDQAAWGRLCFEAGLDAEATAAFRAMLARSYRVGLASAYQGLIAARRGDTTGATAWLVQSTKVAEPSLFHADAQVVRARLLAVLGRHDESRGALQDGLANGATFGNPLVTNHHLLSGAAELQMRDGGAAMPAPDGRSPAPPRT